MPNVELSTTKTVFILSIVLGCFAILWPKVFYPMFQTSVNQSPSRSFNSEEHQRPERLPHMRPELMHPALRERGRAILQSHVPHSHVVPRVENENVSPLPRPGPVPGMRPPMGAAGHVVPPPKTGSTVGILMPMYTICIVVFFVYTMLRILFRKEEERDLKDLPPDPEFRRVVFNEPKAAPTPKANGKPQESSKLVVSAISDLVEEVNQDNKLEEYRGHSESEAKESQVQGNAENKSVQKEDEGLDTKQEAEKLSNLNPSLETEESLESGNESGEEEPASDEELNDIKEAMEAEAKLESRISSVEFSSSVDTVIEAGHLTEVKQNIDTERTEDEEVESDQGVKDETKLQKEDTDDEEEEDDEDEEEGDDEDEEEDEDDEREDESNNLKRTEMEKESVSTETAMNGKVNLSEKNQAKVENPESSESEESEEESEGSEELEESEESEEVEAETNSIRQRNRHAHR